MRSSRNLKLFTDVLMFSFFKKIFGTSQARQIKKYRKIVSQICELERSLDDLSDEDLAAKTKEFKKRHVNGESLDSLLVEAYAVVKNACRRLCGREVRVSGYEQKWDMIPYDVQLVGAIAMHDGNIAEMQTGEGKTLTATLPLYLNALTGKPVHLVTVNDYLARRDCDWMGKIFRFLGLSVSALTGDIPPHQRKEIYKSDIVYGTASEFGFDYLRDNSLVTHKEEQVQRGFYFAIIDETDSILIDEARTPLIISGPVGSSRQMYDDLQGPVAELVKKQRLHCSYLATEAKKNLEELKVFDCDELPKLDKDKTSLMEDAFKQLWLVSKGTPLNKILKRVNENPEMRHAVDKWDLYFHNKDNQEQKEQTLSELFIIVDEKASEYELTDKGMNEWENLRSSSQEDFVLIDLGEEYRKIDQNSSLSGEEKRQEKIYLQEEDAKRKERMHNIRQLLRAHLLMEKDIDYIIQEEKVVIIDENTGRAQPGRRFSDGLHQAIEAKENLVIQKETQTYASITLQNFFRMYEKLSGMTGTAMTEAHEFKEIYKLDVLEIPTHVPCKRADADDEIYMTEREKYQAILKEVKDLHAKGQPILIGTESVEVSEKLSRIFKQHKLVHFVLNAKNHSNEAEIIAQAGKKSAITISTNMAGRGTDIKLKDGASEVGGLHVIGSTRHPSRRIDRQLRGRSARLGDPGSSKFYVSFEDSLMRLFASPNITGMLKRFRPPEGEPISASILNRSIETAQKRIEQRNFMIRKHTLEYDDVMNKQRQEIYSFRNEILKQEDVLKLVLELIDFTVEHLSEEQFNSSNARFDRQNYLHALQKSFPNSFDSKIFDNEELSVEDLEAVLKDALRCAFEKRWQEQLSKAAQIWPGQETLQKQFLQQALCHLMIRKIDGLWQEHLLEMDHLRTDVRMSTVAQKDPLMEFKQQAFDLFDDLSCRLRYDLAMDAFKVEILLPESSLMMTDQLQLETKRSLDVHGNEEEEQKPSKAVPIKHDNRPGRNDLCDCGSGKKYKKCCGVAVVENS